MMREAVSNQCFTSFLVGSNKVPIDVLQYADDTIFFGETSMANVKTVKVILRSFELVSGLRINFAKSKFGAIGQSEEWCLHAANYLSYALLQFPFCYLGILIGANPKRKVVWDPILRKFEDRLNRAPKAVINRLSAIQRQFLWGGNQEGKKIAWGVVIQNNMRWKVGDREKIRFWKDKWINQQESLAERYPRLFIISSQQNHTIRQMGIHNDKGWEWKFSWRRLLFDNEIDTTINFLREEEIAGGQKEDWSMELWKTKIPSKIAVFAWRLCRGRLPIKENLHKRHMQINNMLCPFYSGAMEDESHLFIHCIKIQPIWWELMSWMNIKGAFPFSPKQHFMQHSSIQIEGLRAKRWRYWWLAVTWSIWKLRNRILFANAEFDTNRLFEDAIFIVWTWLRQFEKDFTVHYNQ
ncbi:uncharacterized protein [Glycine max]|uniref:uncharacterized protein n=1 Tax=Glycine max TaxID=3847 RepID=UPI0003DEB6EE|nr:uncharacterized protein LOC102659467 [Glycine max]|eukprot:XP_006596884.1 uncharacterized protein LOC102659467 [Glycine max]